MMKLLVNQNIHFCFSNGRIYDLQRVIDSKAIPNEIKIHDQTFKKGGRTLDALTGITYINFYGHRTSHDRNWQLPLNGNNVVLSEYFRLMGFTTAKLGNAVNSTVIKVTELP